MRTTTLQGIALFLGLALVAPLALYGPSYLLSIHTEYCPLSHKLSDTAACFVLDREGGRVLIQHADLDTNEAYLELLDATGSRTFEMPAFLTVWAPTGYTAQLLPGEDGVFLIDGRRHAPEPRR